MDISTVEENTEPSAAELAGMVEGDGPSESKLFVGQIPKDLDEESLRLFFSEFGTVIDLSVIRDRVTKAHRGMIYFTAFYLFY